MNLSNLIIVVVCRVVQPQLCIYY